MSETDERDRFETIRRIDEKGDRIAKLYVSIINLGEQLMRALRSDDESATGEPDLDNLTERFEIVIDGILGKEGNLLKIKERLDEIELGQIARIEKKRNAKNDEFKVFL